jgi:hypothetical protein
MASTDTIHRPGPFARPPKATEPGPVEAGERDPNFDNQPPLEERVVQDFMEDLHTPGEGVAAIKARIDELLASAARAPEKCESEADAGKLGDLCKLARDALARLEAAREKHNRPLLNATRALKARADQLGVPLERAIIDVRGRLSAWTNAEAARVAEERRKAEAERQRLQDEADAHASLPEYAPRVEAPKIADPVARGDYGARVGTRTVHHHEIESVRKLPDRILKHPKVVEALDKIIAAEIRSASGKCTITGVRIWSTQEAAVR